MRNTCFFMHMHSTHTLRTCFPSCQLSHSHPRPTHALLHMLHMTPHQSPLLWWTHYCVCTGICAFIWVSLSYTFLPMSWRRWMNPRKYAILFDFFEGIQVLISAPHGCDTCPWVTGALASHWRSFQKQTLVIEPIIIWVNWKYLSNTWYLSKYLSKLVPWVYFSKNYTNLYTHLNHLKFTQISILLGFFTHPSRESNIRV